MTEVEIEFCVPCGLLQSAQRVQGALLSEFGEGLEAVSLVTGDGGVFKVRVDGEEVFDGQEEEYDEDQLLAEVRKRVTAGAPA